MLRILAVFFSATTLAAQNAKIDALFADVDKPGSPGYAVAVIRDGKIVHARGYGMADLERDVKITPQSVFDIGSTSKQFTAAAILLLEAEGKLSLTDDIRKHLPEMPAYQRPITIAHLIHHTSGLRDYLTLMELAGLSFSNDYSDEETLALIARQKGVNFPAGDDFLYSNSGYYLLSQIVERASGRSLRKYADEKIFHPLGMTSTHFHDGPTEIVRRRAIGYAPAENGFTISTSNYHVTGDGAVYTTVEDLAKWDANFYAPRVGGQALLDALHRVGKLANGKELTYAGGLMVRQRNGLRLVEHAGGWMGYRAQFIRFPEKKLSVIVLSNHGGSDPTSMAYDIADLYLNAKPSEAAAEKKEAVRLAPEALARYSGTYYFARQGTYPRIEVREGTLTYVSGPNALALIPVGGARFRVDVPVPTFVTFHERGATVEQEGSESEMTRVEFAAPAVAALPRYAGRYRSEELQAAHRVRVGEGALWLKVGYQLREMKLEPRERDVFEGEGVIVRFRRDTGGAITGYSVDAGRVTGIAFERF